MMDLPRRAFNRETMDAHALKVLDNCRGQYVVKKCVDLNLVHGAHCNFCGTQAKLRH